VDEPRIVTMSGSAWMEAKSCRSKVDGRSDKARFTEGVPHI